MMSAEDCEETAWNGNHVGCQGKNMAENPRGNRTVAAKRHQVVLLRGLAGMEQARQRF
jgi:hypothetical protein